MAIDRNDLKREEETDSKVSVSKDIKRVMNGDVGGVLRDDIEELKADFNAADDKVEAATEGRDTKTGR